METPLDIKAKEKKQPQERYGASRAFTEEQEITPDNGLKILGKAVFAKNQHFSYYYYDSQQHKNN